MIPSPTDLSYFVEVANLLNLSRAAECLSISQPSLTLAMQRLEKSIGTPLFTRHKHGVSLTRAGKQLLNHVRVLKEHWDTIRAEALSSINAIQGTFRLGCHTSVALCTFPHFLGDLLEQYPKLDIQLKHDTSRKITEQVINLGIDVGIVVNPVKHPDLIIKKLSGVKISLWECPNKTRKIQDLYSNQTVLIGDPDLTQTQTILKKMKKLGMNYSRFVATTSLELTADLVKKGCGIGILAGHIALSRQLIPVPKSPSHEDEICLLYRRENRHIKGLEMIVEAIEKALLAI